MGSANRTVRGSGRFLVPKLLLGNAYLCDEHLRSWVAYQCVED